MIRHGRTDWGACLAAALGLTALLLTQPAPASAHETQSSDRYRLTIGWGEEPAFSGSRNSVELDVSDATGAPLADPGATLSVEVSFGEERILLPLLPVGERPGRFRAFLVPTRPGSYTFHVTGSVKGQPVEIKSTCSDRTFDCVTGIAEIQFPVKDPSPGQLAEGVGRALPRAERAMDTAAGARIVAIAAIALAALALAAVIVLGVRHGRKGV